MPIHVSCPDCQETYHLDPDMLGKRMRCTICKTVFEVTEARPLGTVPDMGTQPGFVIDELPMLVATEEDLPVLQPEPEPLGSFPDVSTLKAPKPKPSPRPADGPKEVKWSPGMGPPGSKSAPAPAPKTLDDAFLEEFETGEPEYQPRYESRPATPAASLRDQYRRKRKRSGRRFVLIVLLLGIVGLVGAGAWQIRKGMAAAPDTQIVRAEEEYKQNRFENARKLYDDFRKEYPDHPKASEAAFFAELAEFRKVAYSAAVRANPIAAVEQFAKFEQYLKDNPEQAPFAEPKRFGVDVAETIKKLSEDLLANANEAFNPSDPEASDKALVPIETLIARMGSYQDGPPGNERNEIAKLRQKMTQARRRIDTLASVKSILEDANEENLERAANEAVTAGLGKDAEYLRLRGDAENRMRSRVAYRKNDPPIPSTVPVPMPRAGMVFASRLDKPDKNATRSGTAVQPVLSRGMVYGLDEADGHVHWSVRVGIDTEVPPLLLPATDVDPSIVLILRSEGTSQTLLGVEPDTGKSIWQQKLPAPALSLPVVVGARVLIPLRDPEPLAGQRLKFEQTGLVADIDVRSGSYLGNLNLGRPLGGGLAVNRATSKLYVPGESREVFVFDAGKSSADGTPLPPEALKPMTTDHPIGSLRCEPMIVGGDGTGENPGYLVLAQSAGLDAMDLRSFSLSEAAEVDKPTSIRINGWISFPPVSDPEKLALITDRLSPGLFGINQNQNKDAALFTMFPDVPRMGGSSAPSRAQVISADDLGYRILAGGYLHRLKIRRDPQFGIRLVKDASPLRLGEPVAPARSSLDGSMILLLTQPPDGAAIQATAIETVSGAIRWQRQLGLNPAGEPVLTGDSMLIADQSGAIYRIPVEVAAKVTDWTVGDEYRVAEPLKPNPETATMIALPGGEGVIVVGYSSGDKPTVQVREYKAGKVSDWRPMTLPARPAGIPALVGAGVVIPLKNGTLVRLLAESRGPEEGPGWRADSASADLICHMTRVGNESVLFTDGMRTLRQLTWGSGPFEPGKSLTLRDNISGPAVLIPEDGEPRQFVVADVRGNLFLRAIADPGIPQRTWLAAQFGLAEGLYAPRLSAHRIGGMRGLSFSADGRKLHWLDVSKDKPLWEYAIVGNRTFEGRTTVTGTDLVVADSTSRIHRLSLENGAPAPDGPQTDGEGILSPALVLGASATGVIQSDGTLRIYAK